MKYGPTIVDGKLLYYEIRNDDGMYIGSAIQNQAPFDGCQPVTLKDAKANARLWAASNDLLEALLEVNNRYSQLMTKKMINKIRSAISKAKKP